MASVGISRTGSAGVAWINSTDRGHAARHVGSNCAKPPCDHGESRKIGAKKVVIIRWQVATRGQCTAKAGSFLGGHLLVW